MRITYVPTEPDGVPGPGFRAVGTSPTPRSCDLTRGRIADKAFTLRRPFEPLDRLPDVVHFSNPDEAQTSFEDHAGRVADQPGK